MPAMIGLFPTCLGDAVHPRVVRDAERVLRAAGIDPAPVRGATCCGQPAWNGGFAADARRVARRTLRALADFDAVIVPSGSCAAMMRLHWPQLFADGRDAALAARVAPRVFELSQYLVEELDAGPIGSPTGRTVSYHDSCHMLRELGIQEQPRRLLEASGATLVALPRPDLCCGFGGTFSVRQPEVSVALADDKLGGAGEADALVTADPGCLMHLRGRSERVGGPRVVHLATALARGARA